MDPFSIAGMVVTIGEIVSSLYEYSSAVKDSKDDIRRLTQEVFALKGALEHISTNTRLYLSGKRSDDSERSVQNERMLKVASETMQNIQKRLGEPRNKVEKTKQALKWPFTKKEIEKYIAAVERCKTWFIMVSMNDAAEKTAEIYANVQQIVATVHEEVISRKTNAIEEETEETIKWLAPVRSEEEHLSTLRQRVPGTGKWFFDDAFGQWLTEPGAVKPVFWVIGKSGMGKTSLFSHVVENVQAHCFESENDSCAFHYCSLDNAASQKPVNIFGSILAQAAEARPQLVDLIKPFRRPMHSLIARNSMTLQDATKLLEEAFRLFKRFFVLIDALNEAPHQRVILRTLLLLTSTCPSLKVLITCTSDPAADRPVGSYILLRHMNKDDVNVDIRAYVCHRLGTEPNYQGLSDKIRQEVEISISSDADGMFRWAQLSMDHLETLRTGRDIRKALHEMPTTLNDIYVRILQSIATSDRAFARKALMWLCFAIRPLNLLELGEAAVLHEDDRDLDSDCRLGNDESILQICQGLVDYKREREEVTLAHDSIRTFLTSDWIKDSEAAYFALNRDDSHRTILRKSLTYLSFERFAKGRARNLKSIYRRLRSYPLLPYVAQYWPVHADAVTLITRDEDIILSFFATKSQRYGGAFESWVQALLKYPNSDAVERTEPLYYAASYDMASIIRLLLKRDPNIKLDAPGGRYGSTPLFVACYRENARAVKLLLEAGANPDTLDESGWTCRKMAKLRKLDGIVPLMDAISQKDERPERF